MRLAQLLLVVAAGALWAASRLPWVLVRSSDGLGQPKQITISGATWSTALLPLAVLARAAAVAAVAVRGWMLRVLALLMAAVSFATGYLAITMWVVDDVLARGAGLADIPVIWLVGGDRRYGGALLTLAAALCLVAAAALLMRSAAGGDAGARTKYAPPAERRDVLRRDGAEMAGRAVSERVIWDALDEGCDLTEGPTDPVQGTGDEAR